MTRATTRRAVMKGALGGLAAAALPPLSACSGGGDASLIAVSPLTDALSLLTGSGGNMLALAADDGVVLVDSGAPEDAGALKARLRELPGRGRVATLINTHYHLEQTGGNEMLGRAGATILAHERTRLRLAYKTWMPTEYRYREARPKEAHPTETFYVSGELGAGGESIAYGYLIHAHTDGDIYVHFRDADVLAVGCVAAPARDPAFDWAAGGWMGGRVDALARLLEIAGEGTRIVPAYGPVMTRAELEVEHALMTELYERVHTLFRKGRSAEDMLAEGALEGLGRTFEDPAKLLYDIHKGLWGHQSSMAYDIV